MFSILGVVFLPLIFSTCQRCFNEECDSTGVCTKGCVAGYADRYCQHRCQSTCKYSRCEVERTTGKLACTEGCEDGYCGVTCRSPCPKGCLKCDRHTCETCNSCRSSLYGEECQHSCFDKCYGFSCDFNGTCQNSCMDGRYGVNCSLPCNTRYASCDVETGKCVKCRIGFYGDSCEHFCPPCLPKDEDILYKCQSGCLTCVYEKPGALVNTTGRYDQINFKSSMTVTNIILSLLILLNLGIIALTEIRSAHEFEEDGDSVELMYPVQAVDDKEVRFKKQNISEKRYGNVNIKVNVLKP